MKTRELYQQKYEAQLKEWEAKAEVVHAHAQKAAAQAQLDLKPHLDSMKANFESARAKLGSVGTATDDAWVSMKQDAEGAWHDLKSSVEGALAAVTNHKKPHADE